jgi:hypothetical protein
MTYIPNCDNFQLLLTEDLKNTTEIVMFFHWLQTLDLLNYSVTTQIAYFHKRNLWSAIYLIKTTDLNLERPMSQEW